MFESQKAFVISFIKFSLSFSFSHSIQYALFVRIRNGFSCSILLHITWSRSSPKMSKTAFAKKLKRSPNKDLRVTKCIRNVLTLLVTKMKMRKAELEERELAFKSPWIELNQKKIAKKIWTNIFRYVHIGHVNLKKSSFADHLGLELETKYLFYWVFNWSPKDWKRL